MALIKSSETISGLSPHEMAAIQIVMENQLSSMDSMSASFVQAEMFNAGFSKLAATLSLQLLKNRKFLEEVEDGDLNDRWWCYRVTRAGIDWLLSNQNLLQLRRASAARRMPTEEEIGPMTISDDDIPF